MTMPFQTIQRKRVIVMAPTLLPWSETFIREQVLAMQQWQPILVGERIAPDGLPIDQLPHQVFCPSTANIVRRLAYAISSRMGFTDPISLRALRRLDASIVHVHFGTAAVDYWPLLRHLQIPIVITLHGFDINVHRQWWEAGHGGPRRRSYPTKLLRLAHQPGVSFIAVSESIRDCALAFGIPPERIVVRHIGVNTDAFRPLVARTTDRPRRALFVARLVEKKGAKYLLEAFQRVAPHLPDAELLLGGTGPEEAELRTLAGQSTSAIRFLGKLSSQEVCEHLRHSRVFCCPSVTASNGDAEGLPTVLVEAQSCGVPVITSARGACGEAMIEGTTGWAFKERDVATLAELLAISLSDDTRIDEIGYAARSFAKKRFSISECTRALEQHYDHIVAHATSACLRNTTKHR